MLLFNNLLLQRPSYNLTIANISNTTTLTTVTLDVSKTLIINNINNTITLSSPAVSPAYTLTINNISNVVTTDKLTILPYYQIFYPNKITFDSQKTKVIQEISASFGDNYQQIAPAGMNPIKDSWTINWKNLTATEKDIIENSIIKTGSWDIYIWTPLYENNQKKFRIIKDSYERKASSSHSFQVSIKFKQVFDFT